MYNYVCDEKEIDLAGLEMRSLFGVDSDSPYTVVESSREIDPSRSPFISSRLAVWLEGADIEELIKQVNQLEPTEKTFKVMFVKNRASREEESFSFERRRSIEREVGRHIHGSADLVNPDVIYGITFHNNRWVFGTYLESQAVWLRHKNKPHSYSTSLNTRLARAVVNIAIPDPAGIRAIDPCCGIGTVVVEALSMGMDIIGSDNNPLVMAGARENIAHFGYQAEVRLQDIRNLTGHYDVAIIDLPYNLCSVLPEEEKLEILKSARSIADKVVVITIEPVEAALMAAGFRILDQCEVKKRKFSRKIVVGQ